MEARLQDNTLPILSMIFLVLVTLQQKFLISKLLKSNRKKERVNLVKSCVKSHKCRTQVVNQSLKNMQKIKQF